MHRNRAELEVSTWSHIPLGDGGCDECFPADRVVLAGDQEQFPCVVALGGDDSVDDMIEGEVLELGTSGDSSMCAGSEEVIYEVPQRFLSHPRLLGAVPYEATPCWARPPVEMRVRRAVSWNQRCEGVVSIF